MTAEALASKPKITLHVVASLDGMIASKDNSVSWLEECEGVYEAGVSFGQEEIAAFLKSIDCYVVGSRTYEHALQLGWVYGDTPVIVLTSRELPKTRSTVEFYSGDLPTLVDRHLAFRYRNIWVAGGAEVCQQFLASGLADELRLTVAPILLGEGLRLFGPLPAQMKWSLKEAIPYKNGFVALTYAASR
jgi:dihydrofolate reductase